MPGGMIPKPLLAIVAALVAAFPLYATPPCREGETHASVALGEAPRMISRIATPIASVTLGDGDWDVSGNVNFFILSSTPPVYVGSSIEPVDQIGVSGFESFNAATTTPGLGLLPCALPRRRIHLTEDTTLNLVAFAVFADGSVQPWGFISAVKVDRH